MTWRVALALEDLRDQVNTAYPGRPTQSDGLLGDQSHANQGSASDHVPWVHDPQGVGVVRAFDITTSGFTDALSERLRLLGASGDARLNGGGYLIWRSHIASEVQGWAWRLYTGSDPHTSHIHVSVSRSQSGYDRRGPWPVTAPTPAHPSEEPMVAVVRFSPGGAYVVIGSRATKVDGDLADKWIAGGAAEIKAPAGVSPSAVLPA